MTTNRIRLLTLLILVFISDRAFSITSKHLVIFHTNDFHGYLEPITKEYVNPDGAKTIKTHGGIWNFGDILTKARKEYGKANVLYLDSGDLFGSYESKVSLGRSSFYLMNKLGVDAVALGNHEYDYGPNVILERIKRDAKFPVLTANAIYKNNKPYLPPYKIIAKNGLKIGIIGLANYLTPILTVPDYVKDIVFKPYLDSVKQYLPYLKKQCHVIIILGHLGSEIVKASSEIEGESVLLGNLLKKGDVDLILGGHHHNNTFVKTLSNGITVVQSMHHLRWYSRIDIDVALDNGKVIGEKIIKATNIELLDHASSRDNEIKMLANIYLKLANKDRNITVGTASKPMVAGDRYQESPLGDLITDLMRKEIPNAQFAFTNHGGIRGDFQEGKITKGKLYNVFPYDNYLVSMDMTGSDINKLIQDNLCFNCAIIDEKNKLQPIMSPYGLIQFSGLKITYNQSSLKLKSITVVGTNGENVPLKHDKWYRIVTNNFMASGGDAFDQFKKGKNIISHYKILLRDLLFKKINKKSSAGDFLSVEANTDGRILKE